MTKPEPKKTKGMCIATRCTSVEQFVQMFHRFVDEESFFVSTLNTRPPGLETSFSVQLVDGTPVLRGQCVVLQAWTDANNPFKTPGVRLGIKRLTANSMLVFEQLLVTRSSKPSAGFKAIATDPAGKPSTIAAVATKPLAIAPRMPASPTTPAEPLAITPLKPIPAPKPIPSVAAKPVAQRPSTDAAPAPPAASRVERDSPAHAASEAVPEHVPAEPTDVIEEKTDVREPSPARAAMASPPVRSVAGASAPGETGAGSRSAHAPTAASARPPTAVAHTPAASPAEPAPAQTAPSAAAPKQLPRRSRHRHLPPRLEHRPPPP